MTEQVLADFDIGQIARSGQCFRFRPLAEGRYALVAGGRYIEIVQRGQMVGFDCTEAEFETVWRPYFDLDADYGHYKQAVAKNGMRICRLPFMWAAVCVSCGRSCGKR